MRKLLDWVRAFYSQKPPSYDGLCDVCERPLPADPIHDRVSGGVFCSERHYLEAFADRA